MPAASPFSDPTLRAFIAVGLCVLALCAWKIIDDWDKMRDEARREKHKRNHPEFHKDDPPPPNFPMG